MCAWTYLFECGLHMYVQIHVEDTKYSDRCCASGSFYPFHSYFFQSSLILAWNLSSRLGYLSSESQRSPFSPLPVLGLQACTTWNFHMDFSEDWAQALYQVSHLPSSFSNSLSYKLVLIEIYFDLISIILEDWVWWYILVNYAIRLSQRRVQNNLGYWVRACPPSPNIKSKTTKLR